MTMAREGSGWLRWVAAETASAVAKRKANAAPPPWCSRA